ncbi:hypothetical protein KFL_003290130 [Klebsormidium nitens]|uniref:Methyltransferase FkbM domain-containing protein n=1 Tax=Klebsormidium nitens TaxID=105231 RepID=A0A1Y1IEF3_KLENI|nr:hypothetical protein KFL_003290130 [Klebsormidium nitens]|eukprot:GAQ87076.1 hypothetical protein KFL_003290130 [Klebsormidium nitens]
MALLSPHNPEKGKLPGLALLTVFAVGLLMGAVISHTTFPRDVRSVTLTSPSGLLTLQQTSSAALRRPLVDPPLVCPPCNSTVCALCQPRLPCNCVGLKVSTCMSRDPALMEVPGAYGKRLGLPAAERVNGLLIEELLPKLQFRPEYSYGQIHDVEGLGHIVPWLLGNQVDLNSARRRVFMDLGANRFETSTAWFMRTYPVEFDEIHAFEMTTVFIPPIEKLARLPNPPNITAYRALVGIRDLPPSASGVPGIDILRFIKNDLRIKEEDTFILKMDIEGAEWDVLPLLLRDSEALALIDELFVEVHYGDPALAQCGWNEYYPRTIDDAVELVRNLRKAGLRTHLWP